MKIQIGAETATIPLSDREAALERHEYKDPRTGRVMPFSVTDICRAYNDGDLLGAGAAAAIKIGPSYREQWDEAGNRGTRIHLGIGSWAQGRYADVLDVDKPYYDAFRAFSNSVRPEWLEVERAVIASLCTCSPFLSEHGCPCKLCGCEGFVFYTGVGGRFDLAGYLTPPGEDEPVSFGLDTKTGKVWEKELAIQLAGYFGVAEGMIIWDKDGQAVGLEPMPHVQRWAGLYLNEEAQATLLEAPKRHRGDKRPREEIQRGAVTTFRHLLEVRLWARPTKQAK